MPLRRPHRSRRALAAAGAAALSAALVVGVAPSTAGAATGEEPGRHAGKHDRGPRTPGDEPLPGYTIVPSAIEPTQVAGSPTRVEKGVRNHAAYVIEAPVDWNGELVMWAHGYRGTGTELTVDAPGFGLRQRLLARATRGPPRATPATTTTSPPACAPPTPGPLRREGLDHRPRRTYVAGVSMGGHVIGRSLEQYPRFYSGALPMCGVLGDQELFDYFLSYNLLAQDLADSEAYPPPADYLTQDVPVIQDELGLTGLAPGTVLANARGRQLRAITTELSGGERPGSEDAFAIWKNFLFTLYSPDDGGRLAQNAIRVAQNRTTTYTPNEPVDVNATVRRVGPADRRARRTHSLTAVPRIEGRPGVPVLTLHGLGDLFVPFSMEQAYARDVARHGQSRLLVQRAIRSADHCEFTPTEVGTAWDDLTRWVESKHSQGRAHHGRGHGRGHGYPDRPAGDAVLDPRVVADAAYGCRFTDPTGYDSPRVFKTRVLYERCPAS